MDEITAEYEVEQLAPAEALRVIPRATVAAKTDLGRVRENNEDKFEFYVPEDPRTLASKGSVYLVCDGMGGHAAGQIASELASKTFIDVYINHPGESPVTAMTTAVVAANRWVWENAKNNPQRKGMGTTLSVLILRQDEAFTVQVGDSRVYRLRDGVLEQLTGDHTWTDEAIRAGMITHEEARNHQYKHVITRAVGTEAQVVPDVVRHELQAGDLFLLCSDGLLNHVEDDAIAEVLKGFSPPDACWRLIGQALQGGGSDNTTVMVVRIDALEEPVTPEDVAVPSPS
ncbi:Stp1/IreP family PP2C-type Ser/Thr phosphatase [bacterium]|nr:MAG: Stp1/IreP family PP2C-type Ser/Thr phosphatase [bacterium]